MEKASGEVGIVRDDPSSNGNVKLRWADLSSSGYIKPATLREATAEEKAAFEQQHQARRTRATPFPSQSTLIALCACVPMARHCRVALVVCLGHPSVWGCCCACQCLSFVRAHAAPAAARLPTRSSRA